MIQRMRVAPAVVTAVLVVSSCDNDSVSLSDYRTDCTQDCDCIPVNVGDLATCPDCDNAAINRSDEARYSDDHQAREDRDCGEHSCPSTFVFCNAQGRCDLCPMGTDCRRDAGASAFVCSDGGPG